MSEWALEILDGFFCSILEARFSFGLAVDTLSDRGDASGSGCDQSAK